MKKLKLQKIGFTLAEVLVTLAVIGVIAALTIPALITNIQDMQCKIGYKKAFSTANQAWTRAVNDELISPVTALTSSTANNNNFTAFKSKFSEAKNCNDSNNSDCWPTGEAWDSSYPQFDGYAFIDGSGMVWAQPSDGHIFIFVDTNGARGPNI